MRLLAIPLALALYSMLSMLHSPGNASTEQGNIQTACDGSGAWGDCTPETENKGDHLDIEVERYQPGEEPGPAPHDQDRYRHSDNGAPPPSGDDDGDEPSCRPDPRYNNRNVCTPTKDPPADPETPDAPDAPAIPPLTERDVRSFAPPAPVVATEPAGVALMGMPMNTLTAASAHTATGELLGLPVTVRFVPQSFTFAFGDGSELTVPTAGTRWGDLGVPEFTATDTSHAYPARGTYAVTATVSYTATVDFGRWGVFAVNGPVSVTSPAMEVRVVESRTALVENTCLDDPGGPAC